MAANWDEVEQLFLQAIQLDEPTRRAFLQEACPDAATLEEVLGLLVDYDRTEDVGEAAVILSDLEIAEWGSDFAGQLRGLVDRAHANVPAPKGLSSPAAGRFRKLEKFAQGGLGVLHIAEDSEFERDVVIKEIRDDLNDRAEVRWRFEREGWITGRLEHPGIVPVYSRGELNNRPFYTMRRIRGESLDAALKTFYSAPSTSRPRREQELEFRRLLRKFIEICETVEFAHEQGVIHRDLKPLNVMLGPHGETVVVDWGLAKLVGHSEPLPDDAGHARHAWVETELGRRMGTRAYASPEQVAGLPDEIGPRSDVYSLGATLFHMITGSPPKPHAEWKTPSISVPCTNVARPQPVALQAICRKAMAPVPADRYESAEALAADMQAWLADEPVSARRDPLIARVGRAVRRHWFAAIATSFVLLSAVASGTVAKVYIDSARREAQVETFLTEFVTESESLRRGGKWRKLSDYLNTTLENHPSSLGPELTRRAKVQQIEAAYALNQVAVARSKLKRLSEETAADGTTWSELSLWQAEISTLTAGDEDVSALVHAALADESSLTPSEQAYAEGLIQTNTLAAIERFEKALQLDRLNHRARKKLIWYLVVLGERNQATTHLDVAIALFPDDPQFPMLYAMTHAFAGDKEAMEKYLARATVQFDQQATQTLRRILSIISQLDEMVDENWDGQSAPNKSILEVVKLFLEFRQLNSVDQNDGQADALILRFPPPLNRSLGKLARELPVVMLKQLNPFGGADAHLDKLLDEITEIHPNGLFDLLRATRLAGKGEYQAAAFAYTQAASAPSPVPSVHRNALYGAAMMQGMSALDLSGGSSRVAHPERLQQAAAMIRERLQAGPINKLHGFNLAYTASAADQSMLALQVIEQVLLQHPDDIGLKSERARIELKRGAFFSALEYAEAALESGPNESLEAIRDSAIEGIRKRSDELKQ